MWISAESFPFIRRTTKNVINLHIWSEASTLYLIIVTLILTYVPGFVPACFMTVINFYVIVLHVLMVIW